MLFCSFPCFFVVFFSFLCFSMFFCCFQCCSMFFFGNLWIYVRASFFFLQKTQKKQKTCVLCNSLDVPRRSSTSLDVFPRRSSTFLDVPRRLFFEFFWKNLNVCTNAFKNVICSKSIKKTLV